MTESLSDGDHAYEVADAKVIQIHRRKTGHGWGLFTLHSNGLLQVFSDHGNYQYRWDAMGEGRTLAEFLLTCGNDYIIDKFSYPMNGGEIFYAEDTVDAIKKDIIKARRDYGKGTPREHPFTKCKARRCWKDLDELDDYRTSEGFSIALYHKSSICNMYEEYLGGMPTIPILSGPSYQLKAMMKTLWPSFKEALKHEIEKAKEDGRNI